MIYIYFDASALIKQYTSEHGSNIVNTLFEHISDTQIVCSALSIAEVISILVRKRNDARISDLLFKQSLANFHAEIVSSRKVRKTTVNNRLINLSLTFIFKHNINATDAIILRSALDLQQLLHESGDTLLFCAADKRLIRAAEAEGVTILNPEEDTVERVRQLFA
jgi:predicted nucleic acid-binding protein